jgi:septal ring factor EnvC (AmiA/AmiB activator)
MEVVTDVICNVGFPIAVAVYLLMRLEPKVDQMNKNVKQSENAILSLVEIVKQDVTNTNKNTDAVKDFTKSIDDLKHEIRRFNNGSNQR